MVKRVLTGAIAFLIMIPFIIFSDYILAPGLGICAMLAVWEVLHCVGLHKNVWLSIPLYPMALATPVLLHWLGSARMMPLVLMACFLLVLYFFAVCVFSKGRVKITEACTAMMVSLYAVVGLTAIMFLHDIERGGKYVYLLVFVGAWFTDMFAYFTGRLFGRHKLIPDVSPKKTVEGSIGGMIFCALGFVGYAAIYNVWLMPEGGDPISYILIALVGLVASVVSQIGDLSMSVLKRHYGIKDFGWIFPGHGGILDRFDSVIAVSILLAAAFSVLPV